MRRTDREVQGPEEAFDILQRCDTVRIAVCDVERPYIVPVSFGMEVVEGKAVVYFHCAPEGMKVDLLKAHPFVCVESDIFKGIEKTKHGITARYESVIGFGKCWLTSERDEVMHGLALLNAHYGFDDYPLDRCVGIDHVLIGKIIIDELTAKRNLPGSNTSADSIVDNRTNHHSAGIVL